MSCNSSVCLLRNSSGYTLWVALNAALYRLRIKTKIPIIIIGTILYYVGWSAQFMVANTIVILYSSSRKLSPVQFMISIFQFYKHYTENKVS